MRVVVIGSGLAGLTAAGRLAAAGHGVIVLDKGRACGGRLATRRLAGGALADHGAQFFTARGARFSEQVERWCSEGAVREWCRGFANADGHARYTAPGGMAALATRIAQGLDVRQSVHVDEVLPAGSGWLGRWAPRPGRPAGSLIADAVILTAPVPQSAALLAGHARVPALSYLPTLALLLTPDRPVAVPSPGGVQLEDDPTWSWIADNVAKGASVRPALTFHTRHDVAAARFEDDTRTLSAELLEAARPWLGGAGVGDVALHRWRYAIPAAPHPQRCWSAADGRLVLAGDAFGGPRVEGAYLSGLAAAEVVNAAAG